MFILSDLGLSFPILHTSKIMKWFAMSKLQTQPHHHDFLATTKEKKQKTPHNSSKIPYLIFTHKTKKTEI